MTKAMVRNGLLAALDIGSSKVSCFIARPQLDGTPKIIGFGYQKSRGVKNGIISDMKEAEAAIRNAVETAEQMARERIGSVIVNVANSQLESDNIGAEINISNHAITPADVSKVIDKGVSQIKKNSAEHIHCIPTGYIIDNNEIVRDPRGMFGNTLGVNIHVVKSPLGPIRNLQTVIERCHLEIASLIASPYAAGFSTLVEDEKELGVVVIEMGGGTTNIAVFVGGCAIHAGSIPIGGLHVTSDIARGLTTTLNYAERLKTLHGSTILSPRDDREKLSIPLVGEDDETNTTEIKKSLLVQIIRPRIEETFELVARHLQKHGLDNLASRRVVLTGGASQLQGIREVAAQVLRRQVRMGKPQNISGLPQTGDGSAFAACAGLLNYALQNKVEVPEPEQAPQLCHKPASKFGRIGQWLLQNF